jgi:hypothetical protein
MHRLEEDIQITNEDYISETHLAKRLAFRDWKQINQRHNPEMLSYIRERCDYYMSIALRNYRSSVLRDICVQTKKYCNLDVCPLSILYGDCFYWLNLLTPFQRYLLYLRYVEEMSSNEVAEHLGVTSRMVNYYLEYIRNVLKSAKGELDDN